MKKGSGEKINNLGMIFEDPDDSELWFSLKELFLQQGGDKNSSLFCYRTKTDVLKIRGENDSDIIIDLIRKNLEIIKE